MRRVIWIVRVIRFARHVRNFRVISLKVIRVIGALSFIILFSDNPSSDNSKTSSYS